ncbi:hypothetical protein AN639_11650 [Candidatus Epulonipiscium fishelsonii]|uniref:Uncharacterized protein n=1 Tax=Candidatus Epulonipiscium fishelsonii TaxID=77094 RepID=A0ACC8XGA8_9FIRM|nr:hypothetical protein AN396_01755 [Epulopiscium sp. SCG-B11WGA-EpuloA1]ONI42965.1 hypothetical protein AN639_11650 [Epulopiscium sp. SCG-B05WGA-EpuloA1]
MRKNFNYTSYSPYKEKKQNLQRVIIIFIIFIIIFGGYLFDMQQEFKCLMYPEVEDMAFTLEDFIQPHLSCNINKSPTKVKGVYIPAHKINKIDELIELANSTEINSFIIDIKDDYGHLNFPTTNPMLIKMGGVSKTPYLQDIDEIMDKLYKNNIYPIARIVVFKDKMVAKKVPEQMMQDHNGKIYENKSGETWLNPYDKRNWEYILEVCKEAINMGFKEVQLDYLRFHESMSSSRVNIPKDYSKMQVITDFVEYITNKLEPLGIFVSADVFGTIITSKIDAEIVGQDYKALVSMLDSICPMIYPSHYGEGSFGQKHPDLAPYEIILAAMQASNKVISELPLEERKAIVRPWLQDFTASWIKNHQVYEKEQVRQQIEGVYDALLSEWILWNGAAVYTEDALLNN